MRTKFTKINESFGETMNSSYRTLCDVILEWHLCFLVYSMNGKSQVTRESVVSGQLASFLIFSPNIIQKKIQRAIKVGVAESDLGDDKFYPASRKEILVW